MEDDDDWETAIIPDLLEREKQLLEERRKMEEADAELAEELFSDNNYKSIITNATFKPITPSKDKIKDKNKTRYSEEKKQYLLQIQKQKSELSKRKKEEQQRIKAIYGSAELDDYTEMYGHLEDKY